VFGCQNTIENRAEGGNPMILPFPLQPGKTAVADTVAEPT
jgi:hypothetical protein